MTTNDLPLWVEYAQALVTPVVAVAGIIVAWGQYSLARTRMQHDLYDRRYKVFDGARHLIAEIVREGRSRNEQVFTYRRETGDAIFLFDGNVVRYLKDLEKRAFRLAHLSVIIANDHHVGRDAAIHEEAQLLEWFTEQFDVLVDKFKPALNLKGRLLS